MKKLGGKVQVTCANGINRPEMKNSAKGLMCVNVPGDMDYSHDKTVNKGASGIG